MKSFIVFALLVAVAVAAPPRVEYNGDPKAAEILQNENTNIGVGGYTAQSKTSNGIERNEEGNLINAGTDDEAFVVRGQYSYPGPDGVLYTVTYTADATGFHPEGAHLPKAA